MNSGEKPPLPPSLAAEIEKLAHTREKQKKTVDEFRGSIRNNEPVSDAERIEREQSQAEEAEKAYGDKGPYWKDRD